MTGSDGVATLNVPTSGMVSTGALNGESELALVTVAGVVPGEHLDIPLPAPPEQDGRQVHAILGSYDGADHYTGSSGSSFVTGFGLSGFWASELCIDADTVDIIEIARAADHSSLAWTAALDAPIADTVVFPSTWSTDFVRRRVQFTSVAADLAALPVRAFAVDRPRRDVLWYWDVAIANSVGEVEIAAPSGFGAPEVELEARVTLGANDSFGVLARTTPEAVPPQIPFDPDALPQRASLTLDDSDPRSPIAAWSNAGPEGQGTVIAFFGEDSDRAMNITWAMILPPEATTARVPTLPDSIGSLAPSATSTWSGLTAVVTASSAMTTPSEFRRYATGVFVRWNWYLQGVVPSGLTHVLARETYF